MIKNLEWGLTRGDLNIYRENKKKLKSNMQENPLFGYLPTETRIIIAKLKVSSKFAMLRVE